MAMMISKFHKLIQSRLLWGAFLIIIVFSFVVWGMVWPSDVEKAERANAAGTLDGQPVSQGEYRSAYLSTYLARALALGREVQSTPATDAALRKLSWQRLATLREVAKLGIVATDLKSGQGILFRSGNTGQAVRASSAVPGVFEPVRIGSREYVDGGLVAPVPVRYARQLGGDVVVAIDISSEPTAQASSSQAQVVLKTFSIMGRNINTNELKTADVVLRPALAGVSSADFSNRERSIEAGRAAMRQALPRIRQLLAQGVR